MDDKLLLAGARHKHKLEMDVFTAAWERMRYIYTHYDMVIVNWSGGKDSTSILEIARSVAREQGKLPIKVWFLDEEVIYPETIDLIHRHLADPEIEFHWIAVPCIYRNACSEVEPDFIPWQPEKRHLWVREPDPAMYWPLGFDDQGLPVMSTWRVPPSVDKHVLDRMFVQPNPGLRIIKLTGLRTEESHVRYTGLVSSGSFLTEKDYGVYHGRPIYDWTARDVWLAFKTFQWDYNRAYDKLWRLGRSPKDARIAPLFHAEAAMQLALVKRGWPRFWPKVRARVRGAQAVANYKGKLHKVALLPGENWAMAANRYLEMVSTEQDRIAFIKYIQDRLNEHSEHTTQPFPDADPCVVCNICWKTVARAIALGDRQQRMLMKQFNRKKVNPIPVEENYG